MLHLSCSDWFAFSRGSIKFRNLRLVTIVAAKYQVQEVLDEAKDRLKLYYPSDSLKKWHQVRFHGDSGAVCGSLCIRRSDSIAVVHLCRLLGAHEILPAALYECCRLEGQEALVRGVVYDEEVVRLTEDDMLLCLAARHRLIQENTQLFKTFIDYRVFRGIHPDACGTREQCRGEVRKLTYRAFERNTVSDADPLGRWTTFLDEVPEQKPCTFCRKALQKTLNDQTEAVWSKLGDIFRVDHWPSNDAGKNSSNSDNGVVSGSDINAVVKHYSDLWPLRNSKCRLTISIPTTYAGAVLRKYVHNRACR